MREDELYAVIKKKILGSGTTNYNVLTNKPSVGSVELYGNKTLADLGIVDYSSTIDQMGLDEDALSIELERLKAYIEFVDKPTTWSAIDSAVTNNLAKDFFNIGDMITDFVWTDVESNTSYNYDMQVNHFEDIELEDGTFRKDAMWVQAHWAHPFGVQFSHERAFLRCPEGLPSGTYYFTIESTWGSNITAGDIVCFTISNDVPVGGRIAGCYGAPDQAKSNWRIYVFDADGLNTLETAVPTFTAAGTNLGVQKNNQRSGNLNSTQEMAYGWNRWKTSALRQYLNSSASKNEWWVAQDEWDIAPNQLSTKAGFLSGCSEDFINAIKTVKVTTYTNTVNDGGGADITYDKVIVPSLEQIYVSPEISGEGHYHDYWKQKSGSNSPLAQFGTYPNMITYDVENHTSAQGVTLRSARRPSALSRWYVSSSGYVYGYHGASYAWRFSPLVAI